MRLSHVPSPVHSHGHRQSFTEQMRGLPPSPRANRHLSLSQAQIQDLLNNPPTAGAANPAFAGRDWQHISVGELVNQEIKFVDLETGVEAATNVRPVAERSWKPANDLVALNRIKLAGVTCSVCPLRQGSCCNI